MRASKESAAKALLALHELTHPQTKDARREELRNEIAEFLNAAERKLPRDASFEKAKAKK